MGAQTALVLRDDNGANVTFQPVTDGPRAEWRDTTASVPFVGQKRLLLEVQSAPTKGGLMRSLFRTESPILETPVGAASDGYQAPPEVAHVVSVQTTIISHERATSENIADALRMHVHAVSGAAATADNVVTPAGTTADTFRDVANTRNITYALVNRLPPN